MTVRDSISYSVENSLLTIKVKKILAILQKVFTKTTRVVRVIKSLCQDKDMQPALECH